GRVPSHILPMVHSHVAECLLRRRRRQDVRHPPTRPDFSAAYPFSAVFAAHESASTPEGTQVYELNVTKVHEVIDRQEVIRLEMQITMRAWLRLQEREVRNFLRIGELGIPWPKPDNSPTLLNWERAQLNTRRYLTIERTTDALS